MPLTSHISYNMSDGKICDTVTSTILRLDADNGLSGWGEVCPIPHYLPAYADGVAPALGELAPVIFGTEALGVEAKQDNALAFFMQLRCVSSNKAQLGFQLFAGSSHLVELMIRDFRVATAISRFMRTNSFVGLTQLSTEGGD